MLILFCFCQLTYEFFYSFFQDGFCFLIWSINVDILAYNWESFKTYNFSSLDTEAEGSQDDTGQTDLNERFSLKVKQKNNENVCMQEIQVWTVTIQLLSRTVDTE